MSGKHITNRIGIVNRALKSINASDNQYKQSPEIVELKKFYKKPLVKAVTRLNKVHKDSFQTIADEVFDGEVSRQAVEQNYTEVTK